ncbi:MAG: 16S rRNA (guanine(966)-N(2))-methyltransferase RsmD [Oscillospiraceae bacterium]|jgi:16S rRNA (guanine(966)-N(2))-methyltransferase RsmD|nr:16S rRNA (guanine(966)-N(2))-methyltransferase RsmD [Oscillospiraceae bacterium]
MRVISGTARGRKLREPSGFDIRPTSDMVKESVFNIVQFDIEGRRVLDLFAGTGQLGIEALSRGAQSAVFVDASPEAQKLIRENIKLCGFADRANSYLRDAIKYLKGCEGFDLIFLDPPYDTALVGRTISTIIEFDKLNVNGIIMCETRADMSLPPISPPYCLEKEYIYGRVKIIRLCRNGA